MIIKLLLPIYVLFAFQAYANSIKKIEITGADRVEPSMVKSYLGFDINQSITETKRDEAIKKLHETGLFENIHINEKNDIVTVKLVENPLIHTMAIEGNKRIKTEDILPELIQSSRSILNKHKIQIDLETIKRLYQKNGRYAASVEAKIIKLPNNRINLIYEVNEGPKTLVRAIHFVGNKNVSNAKLKDVIITREDKWFRFLSEATKFDHDKVRYDREMIIDFYLSRGFADVEVEQPLVNLSTQHNSFEITFIIKEGEIYKIGQVNIDNHLPKIANKDIEKNILVKTNQVFDNNEVKESVEAINKMLADHGYPFSIADVELDKNPAEKKVNLKFIVAEGPKFYINQINIKGNIRTIDKVIRREFKIAEGDPYRSSAVQKAEKNLRDLDYFDPVTIKPVQSERAEDRVDLETEVKEKSTGNLNFATGLSTVQGVVGKIGYNERNLAGRGYEIDVSLMKTKRDTDFRASLTDPYFMDYDLSAGIDYENVIYDRARNQDRNFSQYTNSLGMRFRYELIDNLYYGTFYRYKHDKIKDIADNASILLREQIGRRIISSIGHSLMWNTVDSKQYPTKGVFAKISQEFAGIVRGANYFRNDLKVNYYKPVYKQDVVLLLQAGAGHIQSLNNKRIPITERFFVGGDDLRGFRTGGVGPRDKLTSEAVGGNTYYTARAQLSVPLGLPKELDIRGVLFTDVGGLFGIDYKNYPNSGHLKETIYDSKSMRAAVGAGIAWHSPVGLIGLSASRSVKKEDFDKEKVIRFSIMSEF